MKRGRRRERKPVVEKMSAGQDEKRQPERRTSRRVGAEHAARLRFVTRISGARGLSGEELWPTLICRTHDVSEEGLGLDVPAIREGDRGFFGVVSPVHVTLGLPTGVVEARGITVRYAKAEGDSGSSEFFVGIRITDVDGDSADILRAYLHGPG